MTVGIAIWCGVVGLIFAAILMSIWHNLGLNWVLIPLFIFLAIFLPVVRSGVNQILELMSYWADQRSIIRIGDKWLYCIERQGIASRQTRCRRVAIQSIKVASFESLLSAKTEDASQDEPVDSIDLPPQAILIMPVGAKRPLVAGYGYDRDLLVPVAKALLEAVAANGSSNLTLPTESPRDLSIANDSPESARVATAGPKLEIDPPLRKPDEIAADLSNKQINKPAHSLAVVLEESQGTTIILPPPGYRGGIGTLMTHSCFCLLILGVATAFTVPHMMRGQFQFNGGTAVFAVFAVVGVSTFLISMNNARSKSVFVINASTLVFSQVGPFRKIEKQWDIASITDIRKERTGIQINGVDLLQLQIHLNDKKKCRLLTGRDPDELAWLAQELRRAAHLPVAGSSTATSG